jgi:hypothetical protein
VAVPLEFVSGSAASQVGLIEDARSAVLPSPLALFSRSDVHFALHLTPLQRRTVVCLKATQSSIAWYAEVQKSRSMPGESGPARRWVIRIPTMSSSGSEYPDVP